jgi:hypothetical protein
MSKTINALLSRCICATRALSMLFQNSLREREVAAARKVFREGQIVRDYGEGFFYVDNFASSLDREEPFDYQGQCRTVRVKQTQNSARSIWRHTDALVPVFAYFCRVLVKGPGLETREGVLAATEVTSEGEAVVLLDDKSIVSVPLERLEANFKTVRTQWQEKQRQLSLSNVL